jgi:predicted nucleic acid-binding protein
LTLCDAGPLIALVDRADRHHAACVTALASLPPVPLTTTWPCLTEAMHLLHRVGGVRAQDELWQFLAAGLIRLHLPREGEWERIRVLMDEYGDMPLDFADASLISAAEKLGAQTLFSIDGELRAVRLVDGTSLHVVP